MGVYACVCIYTFADVCAGVFSLTPTRSVQLFFLQTRQLGLRGVRKSR